MPEGAYEEIIAGGHAKIRLTTVRGVNADAVITGSTDPAQLPDGPVTLSVTRDDVLTITTGSCSLSFCGTVAVALSVAQQDSEGINCGA